VVDPAVGPSGPAVAAPIPTEQASVRAADRASTAVVGLGILLISAWGGIIPFVGPSFGYNANGTSSWHWNLSHALLALAPGAAGCVAGLYLLGRATSWRPGQGGSAFAGTLALACGAWFAIGPVSWPVLWTRSYFVGASPLHELAYQVGYALGPGLILAGFGALVLGMIGRRRRTGTVVVTTRTVELAEGSSQVAPVFGDPAQA
jgi:hypothetical protein